MFYDYLIGNWLEFHTTVALILLFCVMVSVVTIAINAVKKNNSEHEPIPKWIYRVGFSFAFLLLMYLVGGPERDWYIRHYGDPTSNLTDTQIANLEYQYQRSELLFYSCLEKGQKQPNSTVFNDTNEVIKTCYDIAKLKF